MYHLIPGLGDPPVELHEGLKILVKKIGCWKQHEKNG